MTTAQALHAHAERLQSALLRIAKTEPADQWAARAPRVMLDAWASLIRWHECGERIWRISAAVADEVGDMVLPPDLALATARVRAEAVCYQLPDRTEWIVLARHAPAPREVVVRGEVRWAFRQPLLTYCTEIGGALCAGYYSLADYPAAGQLPLSMPAGTSLGLRRARPLGETETLEEESRVSLALLQHYLP